MALYAYTPGTRASCGAPYCLSDSIIVQQPDFEGPICPLSCFSIPRNVPGIFCYWILKDWVDYRVGHRSWRAFRVEWNSDESQANRQK